jgi:hypothetical protein
MWQKAISAVNGGGGVEPVYVGIRYTSPYYYFTYIAQTNTPKSGFTTIAATEGSSSTFSSPMATFVHSPNSHTFTVTYLMDCVVNGVNKSAGTTETITNFFVNNEDSVWVAYP